MLTNSKFSNKRNIEVLAIFFVDVSTKFKYATQIAIHFELLVDTLAQILTELQQFKILTFFFFT